jgi:hypothetical protein
MLMRKAFLPILIALALFALPGCVIVDDQGHVEEGYDFNGVWSFAMTGCQRQVGNATIAQSGYNFVMTSTDLGWTGSCDPFAATFTATAEGAWGFWTFHGAATGPDTMAGTYLYVERGYGECTGTFEAVRIAYRAADTAPGAPLARVK